MGLLCSILDNTSGYLFKSQHPSSRMIALMLSIIILFILFLCRDSNSRLVHEVQIP